MSLVLQRLTGRHLVVRVCVQVSFPKEIGSFCSLSSLAAAVGPIEN